MTTDTQRMVAGSAAAFADDRLRPNAREWDRAGHLDRSVLGELGSLGFGGVYVKEQFGGSGLDRADAIYVFEELAKGCVAHATFLSIHNMVAWMIDEFADDDLRSRYVPRLASCEHLASYCLTEPNSGSDAGSLQTSAVLRGNDYVLNGTKAFISGAGFSDVYLVMARITGAGISAFLVDKGTPGMSFGRNEDKMGWRAQPTAMVVFNECHVPAGQRVGDEGAAFKYAMSGLDGGRLNIAACSLGGAQEALDRALRYAQERNQFGRAVADFQSVQFKLADMETQLQASRSFLLEAARRLDQKTPDATAFCAMAKRFVTDAGFYVANEALQIHGGYGYLAEYEIERIVRDLRVHQILEGTNEIMRVIVARHLLGASSLTNHPDPQRPS